MSVEIRYGAFYDTVSESSFGPKCTSDKEAEILAYEVQRTTGIDVRGHDGERLAELLADLRSGDMYARETHSSRACFCGSGKPWLSRTEQLGKPTVTLCDDCLGTAQPEVPSAKIIDLFGALKSALGKGQASTL